METIVLIEGTLEQIMYGTQITGKQDPVSLMEVAHH